MNCPQCNHSKSVVVDSRPHDYGTRRRRACALCGARWSSYEMPTEIFLAARAALEDRHLELARRVLVEALQKVDGLIEATSTHPIPITNRGRGRGPLPALQPGSARRKSVVASAIEIETDDRPIDKFTEEEIDAFR